MKLVANHPAGSAERQQTSSEQSSARHNCQLVYDWRSTELMHSSKSALSGLYTGTTIEISGFNLKPFNVDWVSKKL